MKLSETIVSRTERTGGWKCLFALMVAMAYGLFIANKAGAGSLDSALDETALDAANCTAWGDGKDLGPAPLDALRFHLGFQVSTQTLWKTRGLAGEFRYFRLAFKQPVEAGTLITDYADSLTRVSILKAGATYPGKLADDSEWERLPDGMVKTLPPETKIRALRFTHQISVPPWEVAIRSSTMGTVRLLKGRFWNPVPSGGTAWSEGGDTKGRQDLWTGYWPKPLQIEAVAMVPLGAGAPVVIASLRTDVKDHPTLAPPTAWETVATLPGKDPVVLTLAKGVPARAMQVRWSGVNPQRQRTTIMAALVSLADGENGPTSIVPVPPFSVNYTMPMDGFVAMRIVDSKGANIRRLVAEVERDLGAVKEPWDLQTDAGNYVEPGTYHFYGLARPPLRLTYEASIYNNGVPPWYAPVPGGGGWLTDHNPPRAICAVSNLLFMGGVGAEAGKSLAATDLEGKKVWDGGHLETMRLVSDGRFAYIVNNDEVIRIDPAKGFAHRSILKFSYSDKLPGHSDSWILSDNSGVVCHDGRMYVSYDAPPAPWIRSAISPGQMDLNQSFPPVVRQKVHVTDYTPEEMVYGTFLTIPSSTAAYFGEAVKTGPLKNSLLLVLGKMADIGSVMVPPGVQVYMLKTGKPIPESMRPASAAGNDSFKEKSDDDGLGDFADLGLDTETWQATQLSGKNVPDIAAPPEGIKTRALWFKGNNLTRLDYALILDRRYKNVAVEAQLTALEGVTDARGKWTTTRGNNQPISYGDPATAALVWSKPTLVRGVAIIHPHRRAGFDIDVWTGAADAEINDAALRDDAHWQTVYQHRQDDSSMKMRWHTVNVIHADFGDTLPLRAVRIRMVVPPREVGNASMAVNGGFDGVVAFQPIGKNLPLPSDFSQRITEIQLPKGDEAATILRHAAISGPSAMAFDKNGTFYLAAAKGILRIKDVAAEPLEGEVLVPRTVISKPRQMLFDDEGLLYVLDGATRQVVVMDPATGKEIRRIGKTGGAQVGHWDPERLSDPSAMTWDANGKLWVVDQFFQPKRISRFTKFGVHEKTCFGPTHYGGGGMMDPGDRSVVNHLGMKFMIDYTNKTYELEARLHPYSSYAYCPDRVIYYKGHRYLVGDEPVLTPFGDPGPIAGIYEEKNGVAVPLVQVGLLSAWGRTMADPKMKAAFNKVNLMTTSFCWVDLNRDGVPQPEEVQTRSGNFFQQSAGIGQDLSLNFQGSRLRIRQLREDGLPLYDMADVKSVPELNGMVLVNEQGESLVLGYKFLDVDGKVVWTYPDRYSGVQGSMKVPWGFYSRPPGVIAGTGWRLGFMEVGGEQLFCANGNSGDYYALTRDGLLAAAILGGPRGYGRRFFSMPECEWGKTDLTDLRATVEDFHGHVCQASDGKVYAIAGKQHITVIRADGLESMKRFEGTVEVKAADVQAAMAWAAERAAIEVGMRLPRIYKVETLRRPPTIDGQATVDWPLGNPIDIRTIRDENGRVMQSYSARIGFDANNLYLFGTASDESPMMNTGLEPTRLFQYGDGLDLILAMDPKADALREDPVPGDIRLVLTEVKGKPVVTLYRYKVAGSGLGGEPAEFVSPVGKNPIDEIVAIKDVKMAVQREDRRWSLEAAIPWKSLGVTPPTESTTLHGDVGILVSDPNGITTVDRFYWANTSMVIMSDLPGESRIHPRLFGSFKFTVPDVGDILMDASKESSDRPSLDLGL